MADIFDEMYMDRLAVGPIGTNCYLITNARDKEIMVIDPGGDFPQIKAAIDAIGKECGAKVTMIVNTHCHPDHVMCDAQVREYTGAPLYCHQADAFMLIRGGKDPFFGEIPSVIPDGYLEDGQILMLGEAPIKVIHTPGHSPGGICLLAGGVLFCGDTLFRYSIGRTDFEQGSYPQLINSIKTKLLCLPDETVCFPGHGEETTIGDERLHNTFLRG